MATSQSGWWKPSKWSLIWSVVGMLVLLALIAGVTLWLTSFLVDEPDRWLSFTKNPSDSNRLKLVAGVVTAIGATIALSVNYRKQRDVEDGRFATSFAQAADQMGGDSPAVRIAGVFAMAALADKYEDQRQQCIDVLCGYLRLPYAPENDDPRKLRETLTTHSADSQESIEFLEKQGEREVRSTIMRVIKAHLLKDAAEDWNGHRFDFSGALLEDCDLSEVHCTSDTQLIFTEATIAGYVHFMDATITGGANFKGAKSLEEVSGPWGEGPPPDVWPPDDEDPGDSDGPGENQP